MHSMEEKNRQAENGDINKDGLYPGNDGNVPQYSGDLTGCV